MRSRQEIIDLLVEVRTDIQASRKRAVEIPFSHQALLDRLGAEQLEVKVAIGTLYGLIGTPIEVEEIMARIMFDFSWEIKMRMMILSLGKVNSKL